MTATTAVRVLVADDNPVNREVALRLLHKQGCSADGATDGEQALAMHRASPYTLILMDCAMPVLDGYRATRQIRELEDRGESGPRTPIIALTAGTSADEAERCVAAGMDDFLSKPLRPQALAAMLARWLPRMSRTEIPSPQGDTDELEAVQNMFGPDFAELAALYQADSPPRLAALRRAQEEGDSFQLAKVVHALGGSSMSIGATGLSARCRELEQRANIGPASETHARLCAIETEYARIVDKLQALLARG